MYDSKSTSMRRGTGYYCKAPITYKVVLYYFKVDCNKLKNGSVNFQNKLQKQLLNNRYKM